MNSRREQKLEKKKVEILRSAASVFKSKGYHGTTIEDISEKLFMTKGSLYYYFKNKEEILYTCQMYSLKLLLDSLERVKRDNLSAEEKLCMLIRNHISLITDELSASVMHIEFDALSPTLLKKVIEKRDLYEKGFRKVIQEGVEKGIFIRCDPKIISFAILGAINWITKWYSPEGQTSSKRIADIFADYFTRGLKRSDITPEETLPQTGDLRNAEVEEFLTYD